MYQYPAAQRSWVGQGHSPVNTARAVSQTPRAVTSQVPRPQGSYAPKAEVTVNAQASPQMQVRMSSQSAPFLGNGSPQKTGVSLVVAAAWPSGSNAAGDTAVLQVATPMRTQEPWGADCAMRLAGEGEEARWHGRVRFLERNAAASVMDAVDRLNRRLLNVQEDWCVIFQAADRSYHFLWRRGRGDAAKSWLGLQDGPSIVTAAASGPSCRSPLRVRCEGSSGGCSLEVARQPSFGSMPPAHSESDLRACSANPPSLPRGPAYTQSYMPPVVKAEPTPRNGSPSPQTARQMPRQAVSYQPTREAHNQASREVSKVAPLSNRMRLATPRETLEEKLTEVEKVRYADLDFVESLGSGEFGQVFRGKYRGEEVAIKQLYWDSSMSEVVMQDLAREIESFRHLRHKRLVRFIGACLEPSAACLVTEYMPGGSLHHLLHVRKTRLPLKGAINMCIQIADGVMYLHNQRPTVVHRDLKSLNVVLDLGLNIKICDFGLTESMWRTHITKKNNGGSPRYMAPELFDSKTKITERIDIWAMGCIFVEVCGGPLPYEQITTLADLTREMLVNRRTPAVPETFQPELRAVFKSCVSFDYRLRPSSNEAYERLKVVRKQLRDACVI